MNITKPVIISYSLHIANLTSGRGAGHLDFLQREHVFTDGDRRHRI